MKSSTQELQNLALWPWPWQKIVYSPWVPPPSLFFGRQVLVDHYHVWSNVLTETWWTKRSFSLEELACKISGSCDAPFLLQASFTLKLKCAGGEKEVRWRWPMPGHEQQLTSYVKLQICQSAFIYRISCGASSKDHVSQMVRGARLRSLMIFGGLVAFERSVVWNHIQIAKDPSPESTTVSTSEQAKKAVYGALIISKQFLDKSTFSHALEPPRVAVTCKRL